MEMNYDECLSHDDKDLISIKEQYSNLSTFPVYIIGKIIDNLDTISWSNLRITCKSIYNIKDFDREYIYKIQLLYYSDRNCYEAIIDHNSNIYNEIDDYVPNEIFLNDTNRCYTCNKLGLYNPKITLGLDFNLMVCDINNNYYCKICYIKHQEICCKICNNCSKSHKKDEFSICKLCKTERCNNCIIDHNKYCWFNCGDCQIIIKIHRIVAYNYKCDFCYKKLCGKCSISHTSKCKNYYKCPSCDKSVKKISQLQCRYCKIRFCDDCIETHNNICWFECSSCNFEISRDTKYFQSDNGNMICNDCFNDMSKYFNIKN